MRRGWGQVRAVFTRNPRLTGSAFRYDELYMLAADVEERTGGDLPAVQFPDFGLRQGDETLRIDHVIGHPGAGRKRDVTLDAIRAGEDGDQLLAFVFSHGSPLNC